MKSLEELKAIRERVQSQIGLRSEDSNGTRIVVGMATCGIAAGARPVLNALAEEVAKLGRSDVTVSQTGCIGLCMHEPIVEVFVPGMPKVTYVHMTEEKAKEIVAQHIVRGQIVDEYTIK